MVLACSTLALLQNAILSVSHPKKTQLSPALLRDAFVLSLK
jgi:hypothetical protein